MIEHCMQLNGELSLSGRTIALSGHNFMKEYVIEHRNVDA
jgi:hypothetical protein